MGWFENKSRDYFVFLSNPDLTEPVMHYASTERIAGMVRHVFTELGQPCRSRFQGWKLREDSKLVGDSAVMFWSGHSMRHFIPSVAASVDIGKEQRDFVGRWHVNLHQSADYIHTSRQVVMNVQEKVNKSICEGEPYYDEGELMEELNEFLVGRSELTPDRSVRKHNIWKKVQHGQSLGMTWPTLNPDDIHEEAYQEGTQGEQGAELETQGGGEHSEMEPKHCPYFVTISRKTGFRRLHKFGGCGIMPWNCQRVEWLNEVKKDCADACCKGCEVSSGGAEPEEESSSSSGSPSSSDDEGRRPEVALEGAGENAFEL